MGSFGRFLGTPNGGLSALGASKFNVSSACRYGEWPCPRPRFSAFKGASLAHHWESSVLEATQATSELRALFFLTGFQKQAGSLAMACSMGLSHPFAKPFMTCSVLSSKLCGRIYESVTSCDRRSVRSSSGKRKSPLAAHLGL
jgi:hypothetical protein